MFCKEGHEINPLTGRCVISCKKGSERNPSTGRCRKVKNTAARRALPVRFPAERRVPGVCKQGYEINPLTGRCVKKCREGFERNPVTGRCRKMKKVTTRPPWNPSTRVPEPAVAIPRPPARIPEIIPGKCKEGFEINSLTGRCVRLCKKLFERNPLTGRCKKTEIKRHVPIVPIVPKPQVRPSVPVTNIVHVPSEFYDDKEFLECNVTDEEYHEFMNSPLFPTELYTEKELKSFEDRYGRPVGYQGFQRNIVNNRKEGETNCELIQKLFPENLVNKISKFLGQGSFGAVFSNIEKNGDKNAIKISKSTPLMFQKEVRTSNKFYDLGVAIELLESGNLHIEKAGRFQFLKMGTVHGTIGQLLDYKLWNEDEINEIVLKIFNIIKKISDNRLTHGDLHFYNIGFTYDNANKFQVKLIDFGRSREISRPKADIALLLRGTQFLQSENTFVRDTFIKLVHKRAKNMFGFEFPEFKNTGSLEMDTYTMGELAAISAKELMRR